MTAEEKVEELNKALQDAFQDMFDKVNAAHGKPSGLRYITLPKKDKQTDDPVNHPSHYCSGDIECIDAIASALGHDGIIDFCRGSAIKYLWRAGRKGDMGEDLRKAAWYCERAAREASR